MLKWVGGGPGVSDILVLMQLSLHEDHVFIGISITHCGGLHAHTTIKIAVHVVLLCTMYRFCLLNCADSLILALIVLSYMLLYIGYSGDYAKVCVTAFL